MELQQIKYFLAVVDFGTFLAASEQVHVSQPTLSAGIRKLEDSLNVKLFNRGSRAATLTAAGELFLAHARQSYNQLISIKSKLSAEQDKINIGVLNTIPMDHVAETIRIYRITNPHIFIELVVGNNEEISQMLKSRKLDLIFTTSHQASEKFTLLFEEHLKLVVSALHPFTTHKKIELEKLTGQPFIERIRCDSWNEVHGLFQKEEIRPHSVCRAENDESVLALVAANLGVSIMPARDTPYDVRFIPIKDLNIARPIGICVSSQPLAPHAQNLYETIIRSYMKDKYDNERHNKSIQQDWRKKHASL
ncbi:MAG: LysR family transcriptional regulator [Woeseiaceae bacterium]